GKLERARELLLWGRSIEPRDSYIIHQLGVCEERRADKAENSVLMEARRQEARALYRLKQSLDPASHYGFSFEARLLCKWARNLEGEERLEMISGALDTIRRGRELVREDELGVLRECEIAANSLLGDQRAALCEIEQLEATNGLRYASSYHLVAIVHLSENRQFEAMQAIERGMTNFPGDRRLVSLLLEVFEKSFHRSEIRERSRAFLLEQDGANELDPRLLFLLAVLERYDERFARSRSVFDRLRTSLNRRPSTRIRLTLCDEDGQSLELKGRVKVASRGRLFIVDQESGERIPVDNRERLESLGSPQAVSFKLGFSLAGPRACVVGSLLVGGG